MFNWLFGNDNTVIETEAEGEFPPSDEKEKEKENEDPVYLEEDWPYLMVPLNDGDKAELQFNQNGIEDYEGPFDDSIVSYSPPISKMIFFENVEDLRKATAIIWESNIDVISIDTEKGDHSVKNNASEIYEFIEGHDYDIEIV